MKIGRFELGRAELTKKGRLWHETLHPWVYDGDVQRLSGGPLVEVFDERGKRLGLACASTKSRIRLRFLERGEDACIEDLEAWFRQRLTSAIEARRGLEETCNAMRLVHAEADALPGLVVDRYDDVLVLQSGTAFVDAAMDLIVPSLVEELSPRMVLARNDIRVRKLEGLEQVIELCAGERVEELEVLEAGLRFLVRPFTGQKTGLFLDQRPARLRVRALASQLRGSVLDLCCHQGGFGLNAAKGGAEEVLCVDRSAEALEGAEAAARTNGLRQLQTLRGQLPACLEALERDGRRFDLIVLDPPALAKRKQELSAARRAYLEWNRRALRLLAPGGYFLSCSCSQHLAASDFHGMLREAAAAAGRQLRDLGRIQTGIDHPVLLAAAETEYLKSWLLRDVS